MTTTDPRNDRRDAPSTPDDAPSAAPNDAPNDAPGDAPKGAPNATPPASEQPPPPHATLGERIRAAPVTWLLVAVNIAAFLLAERAGSTTDTTDLVRFGASERSRVWAGEYWRFLTPTFLHIGWVHLLWNSYAMVGWCSAVERALGHRRFAIAYGLAGIGATAASLLCHDAVAAGASGAAFGVIGLELALRHRMLGSTRAFFQDTAVRQVLVGLALWTVVGLTAVRMDHYAHGGGLVTGFALGSLFAADAAAPRGRRTVAWVALALARAGAVGAAAVPWPGRAARWGGYVAARAGYEALSRGDVRGAIGQFDRAHALGYRSSALLYNRAIARREAGDPSGGEADLREILRTAPPLDPLRQRARELLAQPAP